MCDQAEQHTSAVVQEILNDFLINIRTADLSSDFLEKIEDMIANGQMSDQTQIEAAILQLKESGNE